jgi:hypothetical protein
MEREKDRVVRLAAQTIDAELRLIRAVERIADRIGMLRSELWEEDD